MTTQVERMVRVETKIEVIEASQAEIGKDVKKILASMNEAKGVERATHNKTIATGGLSGGGVVGIIEFVKHFFNS